jgi:HEAT repeat protein
MFGNKTDKIRHMVDKREWEKLLKKYGTLSKEEKIQLAEACGTTDADESCNFLVSLVKENDKDVQLAAVKSMGIVGGQNAKSTLQWMLGRLTDSNADLKEPMLESIEKIGVRK